MKNTILKIWAVITALLVTAVPVAMAAVPGGASIVGTAQDKGEFPVPSAGQVDVDAGNITLVNITTEQSTYHWAGIYGNATGKLVLGDAQSNRMYEWVAKATYVFFDDDQTVDWTAISAATCTDVGNSFGFVDDSTGASDSCSNTFKYDGTPSFKSISYGGGTTKQAKTLDNTPTETWITYALKDETNGDVLFAAEVDIDYGTAYDGTTVNYQAILPENGEAGDTTATTYYIWIELY